MYSKIKGRVQLPTEKHGNAETDKTRAKLFPFREADCILPSQPQISHPLYLFYPITHFHSLQSKAELALHKIGFFAERAESPESQII